MFLLKPPTVHQLALAAVILLSTISSVSSAQGWTCGLFNAPQPLISQAEQADVVLKAVWKESREEAAGDTGITRYEITRVVKGPEGLLSVGDQLELPGFRKGTDGDVYFLTGKNVEHIAWETPRKVTEPAFQYAAYTVSRRLSPAHRLLYLFHFLEHEDELIADDAYLELASVTHAELLKVRESIPTEQVRQWIADPRTVSARLHLYGRLLGLAGDQNDAAVLLEIINTPTQNFRPELEGLMSGYLILTGAEGLHVLEISKLRNEDVPFVETYSTMQALRFIWNNEPDRIPKPRLIQSMRILLERQELTDLVIGDLTRWEDWEVADRLLAMYDDEAFGEPRIKRSIIRYLLTCQKSAEQRTGEPPVYAVKAAAALERFEKQDPKLYRQAIRFLQIN